MFEQLARLGFVVDTDQVKRANRDLGNMTQQAGRAERGVNQSAKSMSRGMSGLQKAVAGVGSALAAIGAAQFVRQVYRANEEAQRLQASLRTVTGSVDAAAVAWEKLESFAKETPFTMNQSVEAFIRLQSLGLNPTIKMLRSFGNTASALGKDMMQFAEAVADAATFEFERLKEFGITARQETNSVALTFQGTTTQIDKNSQAIVEYLQRIGREEFGDAMEQQMSTLGGAMSNLQDNVDAALRSIGEGGSNEGMIGAIHSLSDTVSDPNIVQGLSTIAGGIINVTTAIIEGVGWLSQYIDEVQSVTTRALIIADHVGSAASGQDEPWYVTAWKRSPMGWGGMIGQVLVGEEGPEGLAKGLREALSELDRQEAEDALAAASAELDSLIEGSDLFATSIKAAGKVTEDSMEGAADSTAELSDTFTDELIPAVEEAIEGYISLREKYDPIFAANRQLERELGTLNQNWKDGLYDTREEYESLYGVILRSNVGIEESNRDTALTFTDEMGGSAKTLENIWENTTRSIQSSISDMFFDILDQGKVTFSGLLDVFKRMAAEMMSTKIMLSIGGTLGLPSMVQAAGGGQGGGINLLSGGGLFGGLNNGLGSMLMSGVQGGTNLLSSLGFEGAANWFANTGANSLTTLSGMPGGMAGGLAISGAAGLGGGLLGDAIFGGGGMSGTGSAIGTAIGTAIMPGIGSAIGSFLGSGLGSLFGGGDTNRTALGVSTNPVTDRWAEYSPAQAVGASGLELNAFAKRVGEEGREAAANMVSLFETIDNSLTGLAGQFGIDADLSGRNLPGKSSSPTRGGSGFFGATGFDGELSEAEINEAAGNFIRDWLDAVEAQAGEDFAAATLVRNFKGTNEQVVQLIDSLSNLLSRADADPVGRALQDSQGQGSLADRYREQSQTVRDLVSAYDGSLAATQQLNQSLATQQELAYNLALAYQQASSSVESLFGNLHEQIRASLMSQEDLYNYQRRQVHTLTDMLATMTDPERIMQTSQRIEGLVSRMWQPLGDEQRQELGPQFLDYLDEVEQVAQDRLQAGMDQIESNQTDINESIREGINNAANVMEQAANRQNQAAQVNLDAANLMGISAEQIAAAVANMQRNGGREANG